MIDIRNHTDEERIHLVDVAYRVVTITGEIDKFARYAAAFYNGGTQVCFLYYSIGHELPKGRGPFKNSV